VSAAEDVRLKISVVLKPEERYDVRLPAEEVRRGMTDYAEVREVVFYFDSGAAVTATEITAQRRRSTGVPLAGADQRDRPLALIPEQVRFAAFERLLQAAAAATQAQR
jgi:hypothetical protein